MILLLEHHKQAKREIVTRLQQLADVADQIGMVSLARDIRTNRIPKIEAERFHLVVLGEFNHGKSTFVNALLGADVLPAGITPTTAALNHVVWAPAPTARVVLTTGESKLLDPSAIKEWVTVAGGHASEVAYVELGYPSPLLTNNVTLVDTPGVNDLNEQRAEVTYGYVPRADAVVFLLDAGQALKESEREFLRSRVLESARDRLIFVLGKMDLLSADEKSAVIDYVRRGLADLVPDAPGGGPVMFPLAARDWLLRKDPASGMPALLEHLGTFLAQDRAQILLDNAAADASRTASYLGNNLGVRMAACAMDLAELEAKVDQVRAQLETSKRKLDELHVRIDAEAKAIKAQIALDLDAFAKAFVLALPDQIDAVDADDLKRYLPSFIEDKFKEWAELEGAKLAAMMERLAEEVISITNENLAAVTAAVADRLGPGDAPIDIRVDSFKYDVGVYAVGALGTTVMLFVNALAGGLLTLAAPILAIVLKSKIAGDVRKQAKEQVPRAVLGAAEAMKPHFDRCVDDFGKRLSEFVTGAGNTLYRGISEVLDRTIRERRERAGNTEGLKEATGEQLTHVLAIRTGLDHLRAGVWGSAEPGPDAATPASSKRDAGPDDGSN
ncbi:MAG: dynamin family protein [Kofleriaceae bacterium]|nr:dynamin family protein [Kofleriaceae bacterium]MBP6837465.1 dynamin family protein [Kofleriaceae bacterium]